MRLLVCTLLALALCAPAATAGTGPDYVSSDNLELVGRLKEAGDAAGGKVVGNVLFVTSTTHLSVYDITEAEAPELMGVFTVNVEWENEEVPTNGEILGISASTGCVPLDDLPGSSTNCLALYDVSDPAAVKHLSTVSGGGDHTHACVLDCRYFYGSEGTIIDATDPRNASDAGNWLTELELEFGGSGCHHVREIAPGIVLGSCQPLILMSVRPEHGGSPLKPVVLATGGNEDGRFIHSSRWPNEGRDKFLLAGGETFVNPVCDDTAAAFMTWDARAVMAPGGGFTSGATFTMIDESRPVAGTYADGRSPYFAFGCSVHWFQEHPTFRDGGIVAVAEFENGTRIKQVTPEGKIVEQGYILPAGGVAGSPLWHSNGKVFYSTDYQRGIDIVRYTGDTYVPSADGTVTPTPGATPGTGGAVSPPPARRAAGRFRLVTRVARLPRRGARLTIRDVRGRAVARLAVRRAGRIRVGGRAVAGRYRWTLAAGKRVLRRGTVRVKGDGGPSMPAGRVVAVRMR